MGADRGSQKADEGWGTSEVVLNQSACRDWHLAVTSEVLSKAWEAEGGVGPTILVTILAQAESQEPSPLLAKRRNAQAA